MGEDGAADAGHTKPALSKAERVAAAIGQIHEALDNEQFNTIEQKVAWILSRYPAARDSDIELQIRYWERFEGSGDSVFPLSKADLWSFSRLTSLSRVRARIQNTYRLFLASPEIRQRRGKLSEEEKQKAIEKAVSAPSIQVFADESGKTDKFLVVGSLWLLEAERITRFLPVIYRWQSQYQVGDEFHFSTIKPKSLPAYLNLLKLLADEMSYLGFKSVSVLNRGHKHTDAALSELHYHLLRGGIEHEIATGRCPLPRRLSFTKDEDSGGAVGKDALFDKALRDRLEQAAAAIYGGQLDLGSFESVASLHSPYVQIADLFGGSIARVLNFPGSSSPKDTFAHAFLDEFGMSVQDGAVISTKDIAHHTSL